MSFLDEQISRFIFYLCAIFYAIIVRVRVRFRLYNNDKKEGVPGAIESSLTNNANFVYRLFARWEPAFPKSATVSPVRRTLALRHSDRRSLGLINLIHFIFYGSIRGESERARRLYGRAFYYTLCIALISRGGRRGDDGRQIECLLTQKRDESSARVESGRFVPAGRSTHSRPISDKHVLCSVRIKRGEIREHEN